MYEKEKKMRVDAFEETYMAMFDLARWNLDLDPFPDLNIDMRIPDLNEVGYIFLRRLISLYYCHGNSIDEKRNFSFLGKFRDLYNLYEQSYNTEKWDEIEDLVTVRGSTFMNKMMSNLEKHL